MRNTHFYSFYELHESVEEIFCFYCGNLGECLDHCPPVSRMNLYPTVPKILIKSCNLCNRLLGARPLPTLASRIEFLLKKYTKKYSKIIKLPQWEQEEINELSGTLKQFIEATRNSKQMAIAKIKYLQDNLDDILSNK